MVFSIKNGTQWPFFGGRRRDLVDRFRERIEKE
jgi:hypothetical protein